MDENNNKKRTNDAIEGEDRSERPQKKQCCVGEHLICAITHELPFDPVIAEDGQIYERSAIQKHFRSNEHNPPVKSPMTNEPMDTRLIPSPQIKQLIESMIENGSIAGELKEGWEEKKKEVAIVDDLLRRAETGDDAEAMYKIALGYANAKEYECYDFGLESDLSRSWSLMVAAQKKHYPPAIALVGMAQTHGSFAGRDIGRESAEGGMHLGLAAGLGSKFAMLMLGNLYGGDGYNEFPQCTEKAIKWLRQGLENDCAYNDAPEAAILDSRKLLDELIKETDSNA